MVRIRAQFLHSRSLLVKSFRILKENIRTPRRLLGIIIRKILYASGYSLVKVEHFEDRTHYTGDEIKTLNQDLIAFQAVNANLEISPDLTAACIRQSCLHDKAINRYYEFILLCEKHGIEFDDIDFMDVGTCSGYILRILSRRYPTCRLHGCDLQEQYVGLAKFLNPDADVFNSGLFDFHGRRDQYDVVLCSDVLEHILCPEIALRILVDLPRDEGRLVLVVPNGRIDNDPARLPLQDGKSYQGHVNFWSPESWAYFLERQFPKFRRDTGEFYHQRLFAIISK